MSATLTNDAIAERFELMADLLEVEGAVAYRVLAYRRAAKTLRETPESVVRLSQQGRLTELSGVGDTISDKVAELITSGQIAALERLVDRNPPGVVPLMRVPGIGPKTAKRVFSELGITTVDEVLVAARDGRISGVAGLGDRTEQAILAGLRCRASTSGTASRRGVCGRLPSGLPRSCGSSQTSRSARSPAACAGSPTRQRTSTWWSPPGGRPWSVTPWRGPSGWPRSSPAGTRS